MKPRTPHAHGRLNASGTRSMAFWPLAAATLLLLTLTGTPGFAQLPNEQVPHDQAPKALAANEQRPSGQRPTSQRPSDEPINSIAGQSLDECAMDLQSDNRVVRLRAIRTLGFFGQPAADNLLQALSHDDNAVRFLAAAHVGRLGGKALEQAQPQLEKLVNQDQPLPVQMSAAYALCEAGQTKQYLPTLIKGLQHSERGVACHAADLLARLGKDAEGARSALQEVYAKNKPGVKGGDYHKGGAANNALRRLDAE